MTSQQKMTSHQLSATLKNSARQKLAGKYGESALLTVLYSLINVAINFMLVMFLTFIATFIGLLTGNAEPGVGYTIATYLVMLIATIFIGVMNTGIALFFLNIACGRPTSVTDLFYGYRFLFKKSLTLSAVNAIISYVALIPYDIYYYRFQMEGTTELALAAILFYILGIVITLPITLALAQCFYLLLDFPDYSAKKLLSLSIRLMKGRKWKLFYTQLSFYPLLLLNLLTFGIGMLWITPYMQMTMVLFFLDSMQSE